MNHIHWHDPVYGAVTFTEPLLCDLFHSRAVQRLADIHQGGVTAYIKSERATTRLDHSVGAAILLRLLGADVVEQAAGLVHDVPHTAFSHVIDFVFPNHDHTYHEEHREQMIARSDLPDLLARHALDWRRITAAENFSLLEQPLPALCADRLDYFLRDGVVDFDAFTVAEVEALLDHLRIWEGRIVVDDIETARWLGEMFIELDDLCWCSVQEVGWYAVMARALQAALRHGIITEADFAGTDDPIMARLRAADAPEVQGWLALLRPEVDFVRVSPPADLHVLPKVRAVDPDVLVDGRAVPLSRLDPAFARQRRAYLESKAPPWDLRIVS